MTSSELAIPASPESSPSAPTWLPALQQPQFWPDQPGQVELVETHISWVFLTARYAFKLKKRAAFDFLDFRSLAARKKACEDEVRLNRRLASSIYLGVVPITELPNGNVTLNGTGTVVDYLVKMIRLPSEQRLDVRMGHETLAASHIEPLIRTLTAFYRNAPPLTLRPAEHLARTEQHVRANRQVLLELAGDLPAALVERVTATQLTVLKLYAELLGNRVRDGRVIEGHGDLRPEHIYLTATPVIVDCIEFNADFRQIDVADELCFLAMECDTLERHAVGEQLLMRCLKELDDHPSELLLAFYKSYRATVRAKVAALRSQQQPAAQRSKALEEAHRDLQLAAGYLAPLVPPLLIVVGGLMGSGKSTLAAAIAEELGFAHLQTDTLRTELLGTEDKSEHFGAGKYQPEQRELVYRQLLARAESKLAAGLSVVVDGTFIQRTWRDEARSLAKQYGAQHELIWCICPPRIAKQRIVARRQQGQDASQARPELLDEQLIVAELPSVEEEALELDTTQPWQSMLAQLFNRWADKLSGSTIP